MFEIELNYQQQGSTQTNAMRKFGHMHRLTIVLLLLFSVFSGQAQELKLTQSISGKFDFMTTDHIGRLYLAKGHELFLYSSNGELMYQFSDLSLGSITHLDTRNPLKLLLFFPDYSRISFLDNTLSSTVDHVDLRRLSLELAQLACASFDNGFWVYDPVSFSLVRFDQGLNITNEVASINQLVGAELNPNQMVEFEDWLYLNDPEYGLFEFDSFGTYSKLIPIKGAKSIQVRSNGIFFQLENRLIKYDPFSFEQTEIMLPASEFKSIRIEKERLFVLQKDQVSIYTRSEKTK